MQNAKKKKRGDKISVTLEWALLSATDDVSCTFMLVSDEASAPTLLHLRNDFRKSPRRPVEDDVYVKKANTGGRTSLPFQIKRFSSSPLPTQQWLMSNHVFQTSLPDVFLTSHFSLSPLSLLLIFSSERICSYAHRASTSSSRSSDLLRSQILASHDG